MIRMFLQDLGQEEMMKGKRLLDASAATADAYMNRIGPGPSNEEPQFAWERPASHPWNQMVVRILASHFKTYASTTGIAYLVKLLGNEGGPIEDYGAALDKITNIQTIIGDKLADQQRRHRTIVRKVGALEGLSELEVKETLKHNLRSTQRASRLNERKRNVTSFMCMCKARV